MTRTWTFVDKPRTRDEEVAVLQLRIEQSGLSITQFATRVLRRSPRTLRRWLSGESPIPSDVLDFLWRPTRAPWP